MADRLSREDRHICMSHIRGKGTKPEVFVRKSLWHLGYRYRVNVSGLPGKPDIVLPKYRTVIFVNGCFWHGHEGCKNANIPATNKYFWLSKIERNRERDMEATAALNRSGWTVLTVWECQLSTKEKRIATISELTILLSSKIQSSF